MMFSKEDDDGLVIYHTIVIVPSGNLFMLQTKTWSKVAPLPEVYHSDPPKNWDDCLEDLKKCCKVAVEKGYTELKD